MPEIINTDQFPKSATTFLESLHLQPLFQNVQRIDQGFGEPASKDSTTKAFDGVWKSVAMEQTMYNAARIAVDSQTGDIVGDMWFIYAAYTIVHHCFARTAGQLESVAATVPLSYMRRKVLFLFVDCLLKLVCIVHREVAKGLT